MTTMTITARGERRGGVGLLSSRLFADPASVPTHAVLEYFPAAEPRANGTMCVQRESRRLPGA